MKASCSCFRLWLCVLFSSRKVGKPKKWILWFAFLNILFHWSNNTEKVLIAFSQHVLWKNDLKVSCFFSVFSSWPPVQFYSAKLDDGEAGAVVHCMILHLFTQCNKHKGKVKKNVAATFKECSHKSIYICLAQVEKWNQAALPYVKEGCTLKYPYTLFKRIIKAWNKQYGGEWLALLPVGAGDGLRPC